MKKTLLFALAAVATIFTSCSSDINNDNDDLNNGQGKGMTLIANVEQPDTRATFDPSNTFGSWSFAFTDNDKVSVGNNTIDNYYTFTKSGDKFSCADAKTTSTAADWYAYYPSTNIDLTNQDGKADGSAAKLYALAGATETATTGADGLTINMTRQAAVLRIVKVDNYGPCDIFLKTKDGKYVSGLKAKKDEAGFEVETSDTKVSVFQKESNGNAGIYYVIVPAGVKIEVWNNDRCFKTTKEAGLTAGKYYTLTSGPTTGTATAKLADGTTEKIGWVQLWYGGPRFATENVADMMSWNEDVKQGDKYVWGSNWRTPKASEVTDLSNSGILNTDIVKAAYTYNNTHGFTFTGQQPGYIKNTLFLPTINDTKHHLTGNYLLSDQGLNSNATTLDFIGSEEEGIVHIYNYPLNSTETKYYLRPVLTIQTVKWNEQDINSPQLG